MKFKVQLLLLCGMLFVAAAHSRDTEMVRKKCIEFGFKDKTTDHESCVKNFLASLGSGTPSQKRPSGVRDGAPPASFPTTQVLPVATAAEVSTGTSIGIVVFTPSGPSWVEVTDANGTVLLRQLLAAGDVVGVSGALPLSAVVGRADVTKVQIRGKLIDLLPIANDNVARFVVN